MKFKILITSNKGKGEECSWIGGFKGNGNVLFFDYAQGTQEVLFTTL